MSENRLAVVVLAAGMGARMKSQYPKVLHPVGGTPMIGHILKRANLIGADRVVVVTGPKMTEVIEFVAPVEAVIQEKPLGTGHAVLTTRNILEGAADDVLVLFGDTPLLTEDTMKMMIETRQGKNNPAAVVLGFTPDDPLEYGRLLIGENGQLEKIVEFKDCDDEEKKISLCNAGIMAMDGKRLYGLLDQIQNDNSKGEFYLTDIIGICHSKGLNCVVVETEDPDEVVGVNSRTELAQAEAAFQYQMRIEAMEQGCTLQDPDTVWFSHDTELGQDVLIGPNVVLGPGVKVGDNVQIKPFCHIEGATIENNAVIGPFARLRPGAEIGRDVHVGNFVEIKESQLDRYVKVNHLSYIGDSVLGEGVNIGAGTITCNYDGFNKSLTEIGPKAFIGSNNSLVAPVKIGTGAITAAGSVITHDVEEDALAITRSSQEERSGWALKYRLRKQNSKDPDDKKSD